MVPEAGNIGKAQVEDLRVVLLGEVENGFGVSHGGSLPEKQMSQKLGERLRGVLQSGRLLQSVALCRTVESTGSRRQWQFDCFYRGDNATLY